MKFIFFSAQYLPTVGGIERYTNSLAQQLITLGHSVVVVTSSLDGSPCEETDEKGIKIYRLPVKWLMNKRFPIIVPNRLFYSLKNKIKAEHPHFAIIQTRFYLNSIFGARLCSSCHIPSMVVEHGTTHLINGGLMGFLGNAYEHLAFAIIKYYTKNICAVSKAGGEWLAHFHSKTDKLLYNAVDPYAIAALAKSCNTDFIYKHITCKSPKIICFAGRFIPQKGVVQLAKAFQKVVLEYPDSYLFMAGDGELFQEVKSLDVSHLILTGSLSYPQSLALLQEADIFCLPTFSEGFSTSVLEAAALKAVIVTTPTGGSPEIVLTPNHGLLLPSMGEKDIYLSLVSALSRNDWRKEAAENAHNTLMENFTWEKSAQQLIKIASEIK